MRALILFTASLVCAVAQTPDGEITGRVLDASGLGIADVTVRAANMATGVVIPVKTNEEGLYRIPHLIPGPYRVEAEATGFKRFERFPVELRVGDVLTIPVRLELGAVTESVTVTAGTPLLESNNASLGEVMDHRQINDLPSPGSSVLYLVQEAPGVVTTANPNNLYGPNVLGAPATISVLGSRSATSLFAIDGNPLSTRAGGYTFNPPPEMIQEFRVLTNAYDASAGRFTGAYVNMVMKSGTNTLRGNLVYNNLPKPLIARDFFTNRYVYDTSSGPVTQEKIDKAWPTQRILRVRGTIGAPVYFPKVYSGRNRTFWMYGFDFMGRNTAMRNTFSVPTAAQRTGDFSELLNLGAAYQIYDPATATPTTGSRYQRTPFAGNLVPASRIDAAAKLLLGYYPLPNVAGNADGSSNWSTPLPAQNRFQTHMARLDHAITPNHRLFASFTVLEQRDSSEKYYGNDAVGTLLHRQQRGTSLNDTVVLRPDLLLNLRYGLTWYRALNYAPSEGFDLSTLGLPASLVSSLDSSLTTLPVTNITGLTKLGNTAASQQPTTYHTAAVSINHPRGRHSLSTGLEYRLLLENGSVLGNVSPTYTFGNTWTKGPLDTSGGANMGQGLASMMLGLPTSGSIDRAATYSERSQYLGAYLQDDWKVTPRLTLNLGIRYDVELPATERYDRSTRGWDLTTTNTIQQAAQAVYAKSPMPEVAAADFALRGGPLYAGVSGTPRGLWNLDGNNFSPRIGLAFAVNPKTVVRTGYAVYFEPLGSDMVSVNQLGFGVTTSMVPSLDNGLTFHGTLRNPFPDGVQSASGSSAGLATGFGRSNTFINPDRRSSYIQRWSASVQRQIPGSVLVEAGYAGNRATGLGVTRQFDATPAAYLSTSPLRDQTAINFLSQTFPNPFAGMSGFTGTSLQGTTLTRAQLLRPYPHMTSITATTNNGFSWYHAFLIRAQRRFAGGFNLTANYTFSKLREAMAYLNDTDARPHRVISTLDRPHIFNLTGVFELPFGKGKPWLASNRVVDTVLGRWSVQAMYKAQSGAPLEWGNILFLGDVHDITLPSGKRSVERWFNTGAGFVTDSRYQLANNIRTFPFRFASVRASGINNWNMSAIKRVPLREPFSLELRFEVVDALNHPYFDAPTTTVTSSAFGQVPSTPQGVTQRRVNLGAKLTW